MILHYTFVLVRGERTAFFVPFLIRLYNYYTFIEGHHSDHLRYYGEREERRENRRPKVVKKEVVMRVEALGALAGRGEGETRLAVFRGGRRNVGM
jgi:hypothetical protein